MKIYWTTSSIPGLEGLEGRERRKRLVAIQKEGRKRIGRKPKIYFLLCLVAIIVFAFMVAVFFRLNSFLLGGMIGGLVALANVILIQTPAIDAGLAAERERESQV